MNYELRKIFSNNTNCNTNSNADIHNSYFINHTSQSGASILEVLLVMAIIALMTPFVYNQISSTSAEINDIGAAKKIMSSRDAALNFVRMHQDTWPEYAQIKLNDDELTQISDMPTSGFIDKYAVRGRILTDIYLTFTASDALRAARIAKHIGVDAAVVGDDGVAHGASWRRAAPDFTPGEIVYRISYNFSGDETSKYLHRGTSGEDDFNVMQRNLNMGKNDIYNIGTAAAESGKANESAGAFAQITDAATQSAYFTGGANMDGGAATVGAMRVSGDITGFRNINTNILNRDGFGTRGSIIADRATITGSVNVGRTLNIRAESARTISGFSGIIAHSLTAPYVYSDEMTFFNNFGLTVSAELLMSTSDAPLKIGSWSFPSNNPPKFIALELTRAQIPATPDKSEFQKIMSDGWKELGNRN